LGLTVFGFDALLDVQELVDGDDVPAAGAASSLVDASGEQVALWAAALPGEAFPAAGAFVDAAGGA